MVDVSVQTELEVADSFGRLPYQVAERVVGVLAYLSHEVLLVMRDNKKTITIIAGWWLFHQCRP